MADANMELRPAGWLDKLVAYHREKLLNDVKKEAPIQIKVSLKPAPEGYVDSPDWNATSVARLLALLQRSEGTQDVRRALRRAMGPTRRWMSQAESWKHFPSLAKEHPSYFYYPDYSEEKIVENFEDTVQQDEEAVLQISNPVESRLPSAQISVRLLKRILEARAMAARAMPTKKRTTMEWTTKSKTATTPKEAATDSTAAHIGTSPDSNSTSGPDGSASPDTGNPSESSPASPASDPDTGDTGNPNESSPASGASDSDTGNPIESSPASGASDSDTGNPIESSPASGASVPDTTAGLV